MSEVVLSLYKGLISSSRPRVTKREIIAAVAERYGLTPAQITGPLRTRRIAWPRQEAMYLCRAETDANGEPCWSFPSIGMTFGERDHTTVIAGCRAHALRVAGCTGLAA